MIEKSLETKKLYLKTFDDRYFSRQSSDWRYFYEYKKVLVSSKTSLFIVHLSEHSKLANITGFYHVRLGYKKS